MGSFLPICAACNALAAASWKIVPRSWSALNCPLRELSRYRKSLIEERTRELNRLQRILEGANIKLENVVKDINGVSSRKLFEKIIADDLLNAAEYESAASVIDELPGLGRRSAEVILAEIGTDMNRFPSAAHISSWAGVCPGNHQSAGKRKHRKTTKGNKILKSILVECAKSTRNVKSSYFSAQYQRVAARRGKTAPQLPLPIPCSSPFIMC